MRFILVHIGPIHQYPPAMSVLQCLRDLGHDVVLCTTELSKDVEHLCNNRGIAVQNILTKKRVKKNLVDRLISLSRIKRELWRSIDEYYDESSVIWVLSDAALKHLGKRLLGRRYILHMFELSERLAYYHKVPYVSIDLRKYARNAIRVVQAEYNRAHIAKSWWQLDSLPAVFPNKPYINDTINRESTITNSIARSIIEKVKGRKVILYQGNLGNERPLGEFIKAIDKLGNDYAFIVMSGSENIYKDVNSSNYYFIPYVPAPLHLEVTSHAYIGVMSYVPVNNAYSKLNSLYCAPNKIYEYSMFGIPMIGNDIPGLSGIFDKEGCGVCIEEFEEGQIRDAILYIEQNYNSMSSSSLNLYNNTSISSSINEIIRNI